jgi:hypothetical protein
MYESHSYRLYLPPISFLTLGALSIIVLMVQKTSTGSISIIRYLKYKFLLSYLYIHTQYTRMHAPTQTLWNVLKEYYTQDLYNFTSVILFPRIFTGEGTIGYMGCYSTEHRGQRLEQ